jgi:signal transduction histidine kinase
MALRVRRQDWSLTPLGPIDGWSDPLRTAAALCLHSRFPTALWWGPELIGLYNDAYAPYLGPGKHPGALGRPYREVWGEIWDDVEPAFATLFEEGRATWSENQRFTVYRNGYPEEAYFTYNLSPVMDEDGRVAGALNVAVETTSVVLANRRIRTLQQASAVSSGTQTVADAGAAIARELARHTGDLPFTALYLVYAGAGHLVGASCLRAGTDATPTELPLDDERWPIGPALRAGEAVRVEGIDERFEDLPGGPWPEPPRQALVIPLERGGLRAVLIAGVSPRRALDPDYHSFLTSLADTIATAIADVSAQEREREARLEAEQANRAKSEFLTAMSHELRTPLNAIAGYVDLLDAGVHGDTTSEQKKALKRIEANQRHLLTLINDILLFARIEAGRLEFDRDELAASELIESLEPLIHAQAVRKGVTYTIRECEPALRILGDRERTRQILLNLAGNAIKFTPRGGRVTLSCEPTDDGEYAVFRVADTGPGIPAARQEEIFDPFSQVERRLDSPQQGAGLGLAISRDMARAMDGDITVESEPGEGASFCVVLPLVNG